MIGLALSGGGSRAMAFHLGCLRALNDMGGAGPRAVDIYNLRRLSDWRILCIYP